MKTPNSFITSIQNSYDKSQPWLHTAPTYLRAETNYPWSGSVLRRSQAGNSIRTAGIESIASECLRKMAYSIYGVSSFKMTGRLPENKSGTIFNNEIDRIIEQDPFSYIESGNQRGKEYFNKRTGRVDYAKNGQLFLRTPRPYQMADGSSRYGFSGCYDFIDTYTNELIELKSEWHTELPDEPNTKGYNQTCLYLLTLQTVSGAWLTYLPSDLSLLDYADESTYRAFYISHEEAVDHWNNDRREGVIEVLDGLAQVHQDPDAFYDFIDTLPECSEDYCCPKASHFRDEVTIHPDWTFTKNH